MSVPAEDLPVTQRHEYVEILIPSAISHANNFIASTQALIPNNTTLPSLMQTKLLSLLVHHEESGKRLLSNLLAQERLLS